MTASSRPVRVGAVSVVIPTHRDRGYLAAALASLSLQLQDGDEILLVGNGCSAEYLRMLGELTVPLLRVMQSSPGVAAARNAGVLEARSEFVLFLDDDDLLMPDALTVLRRILTRDSSVVGACGGVSLWSAHLVNAEEPIVMPPASLAHHALLAGPPVVSMGAALFRRDALIEAGLLEQSLAPADDWDLWLKVARLGTIVPAPIVALRYRFHDENESRKATSMTLAALRVFQIHHRLTAATDRRYVPEAARKLVDWHADGIRRALRAHLRAGEWRGVIESVVAMLRLQLFALRVGATRHGAPSLPGVVPT